MVWNRSPIRFATCIVSILLIVSACGTTKDASSQESESDVPSWFLENRPMDPYHIFAAATATAPRMQLASSQAAHQARGNIAATIATRFEGLTKQFQEEIGAGPNSESVSQFVQTYKSVISQTLVGTEVVKREIQREGDGYRVYVLMRMPIGKAQEDLMARIETGQNTFTRFRASQAFDELDQAVEEYHQRRDDQARRRENRESNPQDESTDAAEQEEEASDEQPETPEEENAETPNSEQNPASEEEEQDTQPNPDAETDNPDEGSTSGASTPGEGRAPASELQAVEADVRNAMQPWLGVPYQLGGESKNGVDCSALVRALYQNAFGIELPRTTGRQVDRGREVPRSELRPGDLIFFRTGDQQKHVGVYLDDQRFVHASSSQGVTVSPLQHEYWQEHYWTTRRFQVL